VKGAVYCPEPHLASRQEHHEGGHEDRPGCRAGFERAQDRREGQGRQNGERYPYVAPEALSKPVSDVRLGLLLRLPSIGLRRGLGWPWGRLRHALVTSGVVFALI
jgi:hypothetical protein